MSSNNYWGDGGKTSALVRERLALERIAELEAQVAKLRGALGYVLAETAPKEHDLPAPAQRCCRAGHTYFTATGEAGLCWCGERAAIETAPKEHKP